MVGQTPKAQLVQAVGMLVMMRRRPGAGLAVLEAAAAAAAGGDGIRSGASGRDETSDLHLGRRRGQALLQQQQQEQRARQSVSSRHPRPLFSCPRWPAA